MKPRYLWLIALPIIAVVAMVVQHTKEPFVSVLDYPTKCVDCERALRPKKAYLGQKTKCFACEKDFQQRYGVESAALLAHPIRFYTPF